MPVIIYATVLLDAAAAALIFLNLPALLRFLTGTDDVSATVGEMLAVYALMQFVFSPLLGALSDHLGRRPVLIVSLLGALVGNGIMACTAQIWLLFAARALTGLTGANATIATACIADITPEPERAHRFGLFHACVGAGFVVGPAIDRVIGELSPQDPFIAVAVLSGGNLLLALLLLPESHRPEFHRPESRRPGWGPIDWPVLNPLAPLRWAFTFRALAPLLLAFLLISLVSQSYGTVWVLFVEERLDWNAAEIGVSLGMYGALVAVVQIVGIGRLVRWSGERGTLLVGIGCEAAALLVFAFARANWAIYAAIPLLALGSAGLPALRAWKTNTVDRHSQGRLQGVIASCASLAAIIGPLMFSRVYALSQPEWSGAVWLVGALFCAVSVPIVLMTPKWA